MEARRFALLIANSDYADPELSKLLAPADDAAELARVLEDPYICGFQVQTFHDLPADKVRREIEKFFMRDRQRDDLLLLYFSGHGIKDLEGQLFFAAVDTELDHHQILQSTAIPAKFVHDVMSRSRSRRQILLLDCCHSGAFKEGMLAKGEETAGAIEQLQGQGRVVLTASNALQYSFEGDTVRGSGKRSIFTNALVEGLQTGDADLDGDGRFSIDDIYSYVCERVKNQQQPTKIEMVEGELFLGDNPRPKAAPLPEDLLQDLCHDRREIRLSAVHRLGVFLQGSHKGRALAAYQVLLRLQNEDDSQRVRQVAKECIGHYHPVEKLAAAQPERIARETAETEREAREEAAIERPEPPIVEKERSRGSTQAAENHRQTEGTRPVLTSKPLDPLSQRFTKDEPSVWLQWVLATTLGYAVSAGAVAVVGLGILGVGVAHAAVTGAAVGIAQWFVLRRKFDGSGWWIPASALGYVVAVGIGEPLVRRADLATGATVTLHMTAYAAVSGTGVAIAQWFVLRRKFDGSGWWIPASALGYCVGTAAAWTSLFGRLPWNTLFITATTVGGALGGATTGAVLIWLFRRPISKGGT